MRYRYSLTRAVLAALLLVASAGMAAAQGRFVGDVKDDKGEPVKGATVTAENPNAVPSSFSTTTDDKGRFGMIGLRSGQWTYTVMAPGYEIAGGTFRATVGNPMPVSVVLKKGGANAVIGINAKDLQAELAKADTFYNNKQWDEAINVYKGILAKAPALHVINLQIAQIYRNKKDFDSAKAAYDEVLKADPNNDKAKVGLGVMALERGDMKTAEETLQSAAENPAASKEVFYNLGEVKFAKGDSDEAGKLYQKAADADPTWGKPIFKLGLVAINKGDKDGATKMLEKVIEVDPTSQEAAQAKVIIEQLKK